MTEHRKKYLREYGKNYREKNKEFDLLRKSEYRKNNREKINEYQRKYKAENLEQFLCKRNKWAKDRYHNDPLNNVKVKLTSRVRKIFQSMKIDKNINTAKLLGADYETIYKHIESQFTKEMSWDKLGKEIHIDHIVPLASAKTIEDLYRLCNYKNLQPLWAEDNWRKGTKNQAQLTEVYLDSSK